MRITHQCIAITIFAFMLTGLVFAGGLENGNEIKIILGGGLLGGVIGHSQRSYTEVSPENGTLSFDIRQNSDKNNLFCLTYRF